MIKHTFFTLILVSLSLILPSISLSYVLWEPNLGKLTLPHGQYIFFCVTIIGAIYFLLKIEIDTLRTAFNKKAIYFFIFLFLVGFTLSIETLWNLRLLLILMSISCASILMAIFVQQCHLITNKTVIRILLIPFAFPVFSAFFWNSLGQ